MDHVLKTSIVCKELTKFLIETIHIAFEKNRRKLATLMPRERLVLDHIVVDRLNKQITDDLGTVEKTIEFNRAHLMTGMCF